MYGIKLTYIPTSTFFPNERRENDALRVSSCQLDLLRLRSLICLPSFPLFLLSRLSSDKERRPSWHAPGRLGPLPERPFALLRRGAEKQAFVNPSRSTALFARKVQQAGIRQSDHSILCAPGERASATGWDSSRIEYASRCIKDCRKESVLRIMEEAVPSPPATNRRKQLLFDRRYGWVYEEWTDPVEVANIGGRGMFSLVPLTAATIDGTLHLANLAADAVARTLQSRQLVFWPSPKKETVVRGGPSQLGTPVTPVD